MNQTEARAVLLRGVNVGGANRLPMAGFRGLLEALGLRDVETFIQSGNAVFAGGPPDAALAPAIREAIRAAHGFAPEVFLLRLPALEAALDHPFGPEADPARIHAVFLADPAPAFDEARLLALRQDEAWCLRPGLLLLHTPSGLGRSKPAAALPRALRTPQTARNLKTVAALAGLLRSRSREDGAG
ncbi:DUF1697 domain-containing protein [Rhodobacter sp. SGA-6-6]|uniref:DUF1697 domain-containing protein n=1 Tax=Rhodobacter sp. SGA-6-6 TaxID=2710882 RepID=UPI0013EC80A7|nr:DUF1697 domain-containing protein [Rhodobacter sp. SGA-6-6]NGM46545.1 DUF1697 domain-containing protein [Rhodobacter sp. SGA-6-6]